MTEAHGTYVDWLQAENRAFADAARLGLDVAVPSCPGWSVEDLVLHHASFQIWITELIVERAQEPVAPADRRAPAGIGVVDWYETVGDRFVETLRRTDPATPVWAVTGEQRVGAWARRQASETSVHRWDAQNAHAVGRPIEHARDYVEEMFSLLIPNLIRSFGAPRPSGSLALRSTDEQCSWTARATTEAIELVADDGPADASLTGSTSDLFLAIWGRSSDALFTGDDAVLEQWRAAVAGS